MLAALPVVDHYKPQPSLAASKAVAEPTAVEDTVAADIAVVDIASPVVASFLAAAWNSEAVVGKGFAGPEQKFPLVRAAAVDLVADSWFRRTIEAAPVSASHKRGNSETRLALNHPH